jgi:purine-binding chemotaxis protein CheW
MLSENAMLDQSAVEMVQIVTMKVNGQLVGLPILSVQDVFSVQRVTAVPRAPASVVGLVNLRGRVVTLLSLRSLLGFPPVAVSDGMMAVGIESQGEIFGLVIDEIGEVISVNPELKDQRLSALDRSWAFASAGLHKLENGLLMELDLKKLLDVPMKAAA